MTTREKIKGDLKKAANKLGITPEKINVEKTKDDKRGDYSTNLPLQWAKIHKDKMWQSPLEIANAISGNFPKGFYIEKIEVAEPGFINFFLNPTFVQEKVSEILKLKEDFGKNNLGKGKRARVEFISANPTGPLHFGNARGGPIGDSLASVLEFSGYKVIREYLHNDVGGQVQKLGQSIVNVALGGRLEDQEYKGWYVKELASEIKSGSASEAGQKAVAKMLKNSIEECRKFGISFDEIHSESEFIKKGKTKEVLDILKGNGFLRQKDGAVWFTPHISFHSDDDSSSERAGQAPSDEFLKDRETVVIRSDGTYTYFASDIAYHDLKFKDHSDLVIDIFGADHHGHVPRLKAAIKALGWDVSKFRAVLYQWVRFKKDQSILKTSKRSGNIITVDDVLKAIGPDAIRFFLLSHDPNSHIDFDLELAREKSTKNPVYYVQYAHARISSILRKAGKTSQADLSLLSNPQELKLIKKLIELPELVEDISVNFQVHQLTTYALTLADSFHRFYEEVKVISDDDKLTSSRLQLVMACGIILRTTLKLLGVSAPQKM